ncbi:ketoreductase [Corynespora cassiicola Philippines]|uniref:Ketoreductase n=1 Tax=Corynespora cassiicola Philippines TaxID=1448308 RepID=A0A2T2N3U6_CORCC|nr:ketoreductase [Corynespora cassiicola Philippines]
MAPSDHTILVTGANGYIALHIIQTLLTAGYNVRGTVRSQKAATLVQSTFPTHHSPRLTLSLVPDLTTPTSLSAAIDHTITGAIHTASPACYPVPSIANDMLHPAIASATALLDAIHLYADPSRFEKVVHLSSLSAMLDHAQDPRTGYTYTARDWNPVTFAQAAGLADHVAAYTASKALSERAVWEWMEEHSPTWGIVCLCPSMVLGPHVERIDALEGVRSTVRFLWGLVDAGRLPQLEFAGMVDVRDLAVMMVRAFEKSGGDGKRFLVAREFDWQSVVDVAREGLEGGQGERLPVGEPGTGREMTEKTIYKVDGSEVEEVLGVSYRGFEETILDSFKMLFEIEQREKEDR